MPRFRIIPFDSDFIATEVLAPDGATALYIIAQARCRAARVECDGRPTFDARLDENGVWAIFPVISVECEIAVRTA